MITFMSRLSLAALLAVGLGVSAPSAAQETAPQSLSQVTPAEGLTPETITDRQIVAFVKALAEVREVGQSYVVKIDAETDGSKRADLIDEANAAILTAIDTAPGITPAEYVAIDQAAQSDEALTAKINSVIAGAAEEAAKRDAVDPNVGPSVCRLGDCD